MVYSHNSRLSEVEADRPSQQAAPWPAMTWGDLDVGEEMAAMGPEARIWEEDTAC